MVREWRSASACVMAVWYVEGLCVSFAGGSSVENGLFAESRGECAVVVSGCVSCVFGWSVWAWFGLRTGVQIGGVFVSGFLFLWKEFLF